MHLSVRCKVSGPNGDVEKVSQGCIDTRERASVLTVAAYGKDEAPTGLLDSNHTVPRKGSRNED